MIQRLFSLPSQIIFCIIAAIFLSDYFPRNWLSFFYSISLFLKDILIWFLPYVVFSYITQSIMTIEKSKRYFVLVILASVFVSNVIAFMLGYGYSLAFFTIFSPSSNAPTLIAQNSCDCLFSFPFKPLVNTEVSMITGLIFGFIFNLYSFPVTHKFIARLKNFVTFVLNKTFVPVLPLYIFGFVLKMAKEGTLTFLASTSFKIIACSMLLCSAYAVVIYGIGTHFQKQRMWESLKNMLPATLTGFSTMSSAVALPLTLSATEKNLGKDAYFAGLFIPLTVSSHMLGDSLVLPLLILSIKSLFGASIAVPFSEIFQLTIWYSIMRYAVAAVPGGTILALTPLLYSILHLSPEMVSLMTTIYLLFDPFLTAANVCINGGFALLMKRFLK